MIIKYTSKEYIPKNNINAVQKVINGHSPMHTHDYFEIEYVVSGKGVCVIDNKSYTAVPNTIFFVTPANMHAFFTENVDIITISIKDATYFHGIFENYLCIKLPPEDGQFFEAISKELIKFKDDVEYSEQLLQIIISKMKVATPMGESTSNSPIKKSVIYILNNFKKNISLNEVASHVNMTPAYFSALFKKENNISFKKYIDNLRFEYAKKILTNTNMTVLEVCKECGFNDYSNFIRHFKNKYGVTPTELRKNNQ